MLPMLLGNLFQQVYNLADSVIVGQHEGANALGAMGLRITSLMFFPLGMIYITRGLLNGAGDAFYAMINGAVEVTGRVGFSLLLVVIFPIGIRAVWFATGLTWVITALTGIIRYRQGKWLKYHLN